MFAKFALAGFYRNESLRVFCKLSTNVSKDSVSPHTGLYQPLCMLHILFLIRGVCVQILASKIWPMPLGFVFDIKCFFTRMDKILFLIMD